jgi:CheY-like chemotaxis protein
MSGPRLQVLVVEDEPGVASAVASALRKRGHVVTVAESGEQALGLPAADVLVCDLGLGGMSGLDLLETLRARGAVCRTVLTTGLATLEDCRRAMRLGACELLTKPFRIAELVDAVEGGEPAPALPAAEVSWRYRSATSTTHANIERTLRELTAFLVRNGMGPSTRTRVVTACAEVLDNAERHAYPEATGPLSVEAELDSGELTVRVVDQGAGFDTNAERARDPAESGLACAAALAEDLRVESAPGRGTRISLRFVAYKVQFDEDQVIDLAELDWLPPGLTRRVLETLRSERGDDLLNLSPSLAVSIGRLLAQPTRDQAAQKALWS